MKTSLISCCLSVLFTFGAYAQERTNVVVDLFRCDATGDLLFEIPVNTIAILPEWSPESGVAAPLSVAKACTLAKQALKARRPDLEELEVVLISIRQIQTVQRTGRWFYDVTCWSKKDGKTVTTCGLKAVILMDGTNVEPRRLKG